MPFLLCQPGKAQSRVRGEPPQRPCAPSTPAQGAPPIGRLAECSGSCKEVHAFPLTVSAPAAQVPPPCVSRDGRWDWRQTVRCPSLKGQVCVRGRVYLCVSLPSLKLNFVSFTVLSLFVYPGASSMSEVGCLIGFLKLTFPIRTIMFFSRHQPLYSALFLKENGITMLFQKQSPETLYFLQSVSKCSTLKIN